MIVLKLEVQRCEFTRVQSLSVFVPVVRVFSYLEGCWDGWVGEGTEMFGGLAESLNMGFGGIIC